MLHEYFLKSLALSKDAGSIYGRRTAKYDLVFALVIIIIIIKIL